MQQANPAPADERRDGSSMNGRASVFGALALELSPTHGAACQWLAQHDAGTLAELVARDLARLDPAAATLQLAISGAHCDAVELLRPGWPLHVALEQLAAGAPRRDAGHGRIVAFGAHDGRFPPALAPSAEHAGGPLRLLPFVLSGDADTAAMVGAGFERELLENGMAGAETALAAQDLFGLRIEHARYLTLHDLAAMMALQYEHAGLAVLWPVLEAALLAPASEEWVDDASEPLLHFIAGEARMALLSPAAWIARHADAAPALDGSRLERGFAHFQARQRQFAAVLAAHAVPVLFVHCASAGRDGL